MEACVTGMKGTLKLNSVAEEEKSKFVPDEETEALPPPLNFLSAMAAAHRPLHVYQELVQPHRPEVGQTRGQHTSALARQDRNAWRPTPFRKRVPPGSKVAARASRPRPNSEDSKKCCWRRSAASRDVRPNSRMEPTREIWDGWGSAGLPGSDD